MRLTVDGLVRALRGIEHALAEGLEARYADADTAAAGRPTHLRTKPAHRDRDAGVSDDSRHE
ncbi:MAG: hypothetical protein JNL61_18690 [Rhizobiaceae bacterium]|nr:hypothetical protein [Rhizobiaceae bacterium]